MLLIFTGLLCFIGAFTVNEDDLNDDWGCD